MNDLEKTIVDALKVKLSELPDGDAVLSDLAAFLAEDKIAPEDWQRLAESVISRRGSEKQARSGK